MLPDKNVEFFELGAGGDAVIFIVPSPHFDVLGVEQVKPLNLVFKDFHDGDAHFVLGQQLLELLVVAKDVENTENVDWKVDVSFVIFGEGPA